MGSGLHTFIRLTFLSLARIIRERFYCNHRFAATTSFRLRARGAAQPFHDESSWIKCSGS